ncbi:hypothetical protein [Listeria booriae]|uniref:hypothetical protein n=1 Tax=Listeria booriae TaxID=1552123 RepID=UPI001626204B|nr:hypothetical protein [Listeria booriae]MBC1892421.1 hypothetical protein [Listeria booriae]
MPIKININKNYKEFEIGDKLYKVFLDDDSIKKYQNLVGLLKEHSEETIDDSIQILQQSFTALLGEGSFDEIYNVCGKSTYVMTDVFKQISAEIEKEISTNLSENQYIKAKSNKKK